MAFELHTVKLIFNNILLGQDLNLNNISNMIFGEKFKLIQDYISTEEFKQIINAFNFNSDDKVDMEDFIYLKDHIQDINVIIKLIKIITLSINKFIKLENINFDKKDMLDIIIRLVVYCILYIIILDCPKFRNWASQSTNNKNNIDILFDILVEIVDYIKSAEEIQNLIKYSINFFKDKINGCITFFNKKNNNTQLIKNANIEINTLKVQLKKEHSLYKIIKKVNKLQ